jgi:hypothetical protein
VVQEVTGKSETPSLLREDNTGAIYLVKNHTIGARMKHIDIHYQFVNEMGEDQELLVKFQKSADSASDIAMKNTDEETHTRHAQDIYNGMLQVSNREDV